MDIIYKFMAFVMDLCCSMETYDKEAILELKKKINNYLDNIIASI